MPVRKCLLCRAGSLKEVLDLGFHPLADSFLHEKDLHQSEFRYPLRILLCRSCGHVMNSYVVAPEQRYQRREYSYDSGNSAVSVRHFDALARDIVGQILLSRKDIAVDIGSSVGTLLTALREHSGIRAIGIEPADNIATLSRKNKVTTIQEFWGKRAADAVLQIGCARVVTATNCLNHIEEPHEFIKQVFRVLAKKGVFVFEVPYLLPLVRNSAFDTMYLEHVSYFAVQPLRTFFKRYGYVITQVEENEYMGGTIRMYVGRKNEYEESPRVPRFVAREKKARLFSESAYTRMGTQVRALKMQLLRELLAVKKRGGTVVGVGAAAKGNTLLNYCGIDASILPFITDASPLKISKYTPGSHIPILSDASVTKEVTHALILPWNIAPYLKRKLTLQHPRLKFIVPHVK